MSHITTSAPRGVSISGLEFNPGALPGTVGVDFFQNAQSLYNYIAARGFAVVRLAVLWERIQPQKNGSIDATYKAIIDQETSKAVQAGLQVILDIHNFGARYLSSPGGFTSDFSTTPDALWGGGSQVQGSPGYIQVASFGRATAGDTSNPLSPAKCYIAEGDLKVVSNDGTGVWNSLWFEVFRGDDNNKYFFTINTNAGNQHWELFKVVGGAMTLLDSGSFSFVNGTYYTVKLDVGQTSAGHLVVSLNGSQISSVNLDPALTHGQVAVFANDTTGRLTNFSLNVNGDTSAGRSNTGIFAVGSTQPPTAAFADLWQKLSLAYLNNTGVYAYDLMNEPHDMPVPTSTSTYNSTATVTQMMQAAITAIRANGDQKYIIAELDSFAGAQNFTTLYGSNPTPWLTDSLHKTYYSFHYYFDSDHSGTYASGYQASSLTNISPDVTPICQWAQANSVPLFCGEYGTPNDDNNWLAVLETFLGILDTHSVAATHWAMGDFYTSVTTLQPTSSYTTDRLQMQALLNHLSGVLSLPRFGYKTIKDALVSTLGSVASLKIVYGKEEKALSKFPAACVSAKGHS